MTPTRPAPPVSATLHTTELHGSAASPAGSRAPGTATSGVSSASSSARSRVIPSSPVPAAIWRSPPWGVFSGTPDSTADLNDLDLANYDFLETLRHLAYIRQGQMLRPVDYHNLGAEELGGVYESLLSLTPQVSGGGAQFTFAEFSGNRRKTTGSYYTPDALVQCLLDSALDPVVEEATHGKTGPEAEQAILDLKVCDPAVGSGHFLVGAAHRLARHLARTRAHAEGESEPSPLLYQRALRDVIGRCLYGVDLNPMSAELCRVGLWLEALEPGKPLTFLDHHIRVGNSLLGGTQELIDSGIPDKAFKAIQGDEPKICSALRKRNKKERESRQREMVLKVAEPRVEYNALAAAVGSLDRAPDGTLDDVHRKEEQFRGLVESPEYKDQRQVADAWCAAFVWPKRLDTPAEPITTETIRRLEDGRHSMSSPEEDELERLADRFQFFHWHLEFPGVFENGGFDCVLGNPPWEHIELKEMEWFSERHEGIVNARTGAERKRLIAALKDVDQPLYEAFQEARRDHDGLSHLLRNSGRYPQCGRGRINLYAVFAEAIRSLLKEHGRAGCVLPTGIATDDTTKIFFQDVVGKRALASLYDFENKGVFFPGVHRNYKFSLFTAGSGENPTADRAEFVFFAHDIDGLRDPDRRFTLSPEEIALLNPNTRTCPIFRSRADAELTKAIYRRVPVLLREARGERPEQNPWGIRLKQGLFNKTSDSYVFRIREELEEEGWKLEGSVLRRKKARFLRLYEGRLGHQFNHRYATQLGDHLTELSTVEISDAMVFVEPQYWISEEEVERRLSRRTAKCRTALLGFRRVARDTDERTCIAALLPWGAASYGWILSFGPDASHLLLLCGIYNSFAFDYLLRGSLSQPSIPQSSVKEIPCLTSQEFSSDCPWDRSQGLMGWVTWRVFELTYTAYDLKSLAKDIGWIWPPFHWDEGRRFLLRCEVDAALFHLYLPAEGDGNWRLARQVDGCPYDETPDQLCALRRHFATPRDAVSYVLDTFPIVRRKDEQTYGEYRTKRVILDIYDAMQEAASTGEPYQTLLDPPPADPRCCHPSRTIYIDPSALSDGEWARPPGDEEAAEITVLAAVLKAFDGPEPRRTVRLASLLAMEPSLLVPSLPPEHASHWHRLIGPEATPQGSGIAQLPPASRAWGTAVRDLRGAGRLIEDLAAGTWALGPGLEAIHTEGWPSGRVSIVMEALRQRDTEGIAQTLPAPIRDWIDADTA